MKADIEKNNVSLNQEKTIDSIMQQDQKSEISAPHTSASMSKPLIRNTEMQLQDNLTKPNDLMKDSDTMMIPFQPFEVGDINVSPSGNNQSHKNYQLSDKTADINNILMEIQDISGPQIESKNKQTSFKQKLGFSNIAGRKLKIPPLGVSKQVQPFKMTNKNGQNVTESINNEQDLETPSSSSSSENEDKNDITSQSLVQNNMLALKKSVSSDSQNPSVFGVSTLFMTKKLAHQKSNEIISSQDQFRELNIDQLTLYDNVRNKRLAGIQSYENFIKRNQKKLEVMSDEKLKSKEKTGPSKKFDNTSRRLSFLPMQSIVAEAPKKAPKLNLMEQNDVQRKQFLNKMSVEIEFPAYYYYDSKFVPHEEELIVVQAFHIVPSESSNHQVMTLKKDGTEIMGTFKDLYPNAQSDNQLLKLQRTQGRAGIKVEKETYLKFNAIMQFSPSGKWFALVDSKENNVFIQNSQDIYKCFDNIENGIYDFKFNFRQEQIDYDYDVCSRIIFDKNDKYYVLIFSKMLLICSIDKGHEGQLLKKYVLDTNIYEKICDVNFVSQDEENEHQQDQTKQHGHGHGHSHGDKHHGHSHKFKCMIACKVRLIQSIKIFDICIDPIKNPPRTLSYINKIDDLTVKISDNHQKVIFSNGIEHYMLNGEGQDNFPWIKDKKLRNVINHGGEFFLVTSKDYDRDVDILHSKDKRFNATFKRSIEPGSIKVFDSIVVPSKDNHNRKGLMKTVMLIGTFLYVDLIDIDLGFQKKKAANEGKIINEHIQCSKDKYYMAYGFNWPYFSYGTKLNVIVVLNAFNPKYQQRYEMPAKVKNISQSFITDSYDLYIAVESKEEDGTDVFEIYWLNLDQDNPVIQGPILAYPWSKVRSFRSGKHDSQMLAFHCRASSVKEKINLNEILIFYMMHGGNLYSWANNGQQKEPELINQDQDGNISPASNYAYFSDRSFLYMETTVVNHNRKEIKQSSIYFIESVFGSYTKYKIYQDKDVRAEILNFAIDSQKNRLMILTGIKNSKDKRDKFFTLYEVDKEKIMYSASIKDKELIGRLKSNLYSFADGHIYFGNKVIKIRYDLLGSNNEVKENQLFDPYSDVLVLDKYDQIQYNTPTKTSTFNRLAYMIRNLKEKTPRRLLITPFLHERKLHLNKREDSNQFYTMIKNEQGENFIICLCIADNKMLLYGENSILIKRFTYHKIAEECGKPITISENGLTMIFQKSDMSQNIYIVRVSMNGLKVIKKINIKESFEKQLEDLKNEKQKAKKKKYKSILFYYATFLESISNYELLNRQFKINDSGDVLIRLKPSKHHFERLKKQKLNDREIQEALQITETMVSDMDLQDEQTLGDKIKSCFNRKQEINTEEQECNSEDHQKAIDDNFEHSCDQMDDCSLFYYQANKYDLVKNPDKDLHFMYYDSKSDNISKLLGVSLNNKYIFFWNLSSCWYICVKSQHFEKMKIYISEAETDTFIKRVRTMSNDDIVCLRVEQSEISDCLIIWDINKNKEIESFDVDNNAIFFQDYYGQPYIAEKDYLVNCSQRCKLKSFNFSMKDFSFRNCSFGPQYGFRMDVQLNMYAVFRNVVNLSLSYMTLVIKDHFDKNGFLQEDYQFDLEGFDFILFRNSIFTNGDLVKYQYEKLNYILKNYLRIDLNLLETLFYMKPQLAFDELLSYDFGNHKNNEEVCKFQTPLHYALIAKNTRMINIILTYMSKTETISDSNIKDVFHQLIKYSGFEIYLECNPFSTLQMYKKQTLMLKGKEDNQIIRIEPTACSYIDDHYFQEAFKEKKEKNENNNNKGHHHLTDNYLTFSVHIQTIKVDWIFNDKELGIGFLKELIKQRHMDLFESDYIKILIHYLYRQFSGKIKTRLLPLYSLHFVSILIYINLVENMRSKAYLIDFKTSDNTDFDLNDKSSFQAISSDFEEILVRMERYSTYKDTFIILMLIILSVNIYFFINQTIFLGKMSLTRVWSIVDFVIITLNLIICTALFQNEYHGQRANFSSFVSTNVMRVLETILIIFMAVKSLYYLQLIPQISPLIDNIFIVLREIRYFLLIYAISQIAFMQAYYIFGRNQMEIQKISPTLKWNDTPNQIPYSTALGAVDHVINSSFGQFDTSSYYNSKMTFVVYPLFLLLCIFEFFLLINMLVALMNNIFIRQREFLESTKRLQQLEFVVDNWWIDSIQDKENKVFLVAAFSMDQEDNEDEKLNNINSEVVDLSEKNLNLKTTIKNIQYQVSQIATGLKNKKQN